MARKLSTRPADVLSRIGAQGTRETVARILAVWARSTDTDREAGARWYGEDSAALLVSLVGMGAPSVEHAAAVVSHLSPRTTWQRNTTGAMALVMGAREGNAGAVDGARGVGCMIGNVTRAVHALRSSDPLNTFSAGAHKTRSFAHNLLGDRNAVTVDVWAARIAFPDEWTTKECENALGKSGVYDAVAHCYRLAAKRVGVDPTTMQATTWITARNGRSL